MIYTICNDKLEVKVASLGAEIKSARALDGGMEYIWQGDAKYWEDSAPVLFPTCGLLANGKYTHNGKEYSLPLHGFAAATEFDVKSHSNFAITLSLVANETTKACYPFDFELLITYSLEGNRLVATAEIKNLSKDELLPATFGAHPGFNAPLAKELDFEDYYFEFSEECFPNQLTILDNGLYGGTTEALILEDGKKLRLSHELFKVDGIFMNRMADTITLKSDKDSHSVSVKYSGFPYLGIWQEYGADTPFICVEPWYGLPDYDGLSREIMKKNDMFRIQPDCSKTVSYEIIFN